MPELTINHLISIVHSLVSNPPPLQREGGVGKTSPIGLSTFVSVLLISKTGFYCDHKFGEGEVKG